MKVFYTVHFLAAFAGAVGINSKTSDMFATKECPIITDTNVDILLLSNEKRCLTCLGQRD